MLSPFTVIAARVSGAIVDVLGSEFSGTDPVLRPSRFADVQVNAALALAKGIGLPPREVAARILEHLDLPTTGPTAMGLHVFGNCLTSAHSDSVAERVQPAVDCVVVAMAEIRKSAADADAAAREREERLRATHDG